MLSNVLLKDVKEDSSWYIQLKPKSEVNEYKVIDKTDKTVLLESADTGLAQFGLSLANERTRRVFDDIIFVEEIIRNNVIDYVNPVNSITTIEVTTPNDKKLKMNLTKELLQDLEEIHQLSIESIKEELSIQDFTEEKNNSTIGMEVDKEIINYSNVFTFSYVVV